MNCSDTPLHIGPPPPCSTYWQQAEVIIILRENEFSPKMVNVLLRGDMLDKWEAFKKSWTRFADAPTLRDFEHYLAAQEAK